MSGLSDYVGTGLELVCVLVCVVCSCVCDDLVISIQMCKCVYTNVHILNKSIRKRVNVLDLLTAMI